MLQSAFQKTIDSPSNNFLPEDSNQDVDTDLETSRRAYFKKKNRRERLLGMLLLVPATPIIFACWALVRLTSKGPGLFRQTRVGYRGDEFQVLKLRTMRVDAEVNGPQWSNARDPRVTTLGRVYRKLHLDELPQLINVARGEMVLTGPRPERPEFVQLLSIEIPDYEKRLQVKPGITGLAQVNLPPDSDLESVEKKQTLDLHYIETSTFWFDQRLLASTAFRVLLIRGEKLNDVLHVNKQHLIEHFSTSVNDGSNGSTMLSELLHRSATRSEWHHENSNDQRHSSREVARSVRHPR